MDILVVNNFVRDGSGIDTFVRLEVTALRRLGHRVRVFGTDNSSLDRARGISKAALLASTLYSVPARQSLQRLLATSDIDLVYVHNTVPLLTGSIYDALRDHSAVTVQHLHNYRAFCLNSYAYRGDESCDLCTHTAFTACTAHWCYRDSLVASAALTAARLIDCSRGRRSGYGVQTFIANSAFTKREHVRHGLAEDRIWVLPNPSDDLAASIDHPHGVPPERHKVLTFVGSLLRAKGIYAVLDLAEAMPDWEVRLMGTGPEEDSLRRQIQMRRLHNVGLTGLLAGADKARVWNDTFVTLMPSLWDEPFGLVVPESYSLSIPVIATGSGGTAEIVRDGQTGFIQSFRDPAATATLLEVLWNDEKRYLDMCRVARSFYEAEFAEEVFAERLGRLQAQILDRDRSLRHPHT